jgi:hypothetical protein
MQTTLMQKPSADDEADAEDQEADVPGKRSAQIVPDMVDLENVMVHQPFHDVENSPPC